MAVPNCTCPVSSDLLQPTVSLRPTSGSRRSWELPKAIFPGQVILSFPAGISESTAEPKGTAVIAAPHALRFEGRDHIAGKENKRKNKIGYVWLWLLVTTALIGAQ